MDKKGTQLYNSAQGAGEAGTPGFAVNNAEETRPMSLKKELVGLLCLVLALAIFCGVCSSVLIPKRHDYGAVWDMYLKEPEDSVDVLFFGTSLAYCDVVPSVLYEQSGVTSFVMAGPTQTFPVTYRYLREAVKTQSPQAAFFEATWLFGERSNDSVKVNLTYMPWSMERLIPTFEETLTESGEAEEERETRAGLLFPLYAYHDRWDELDRRDLTEGLFGYETDPLAGYTFLDQVTPIEEFTLRQFEDQPDTYQRNLSYAQQAIEFCKEQNIRPVFFISPSTQRLSEEQTETLRRDLTALGAEFVDFNGEMFDEMGFDLSTDFFDPRHLNCRGAEKFSKYLASMLSQWEITPGGKGDAALWEDRREEFSSRLEEADSKPIRLNPIKE